MVNQPTFRGISQETGEWVYGFGWRQIEQAAMLYTENGVVRCFLESMGKMTEHYDNERTPLFEGDICLFTPFPRNPFKEPQLPIDTQLIPFRGIIRWRKGEFFVQNIDYTPIRPQKGTHTEFHFPFEDVTIQKLKTMHDYLACANQT